MGEVKDRTAELKAVGCQIVEDGKSIGVIWHDDSKEGFERAVTRAAYIIKAANGWPKLEKLLKAAEAIETRKFSTYKRKGRDVGIEGDDGEKCWIVHSDEISELEFAIEDIRAALADLGEG